MIEKLVDEVVYLPGARITNHDVTDADILVVRTRTLCNESLLNGSRVKLVVTATIGFDHLDTAYLEREGIEWHNCPGCNATSVAQYVRNSLLLLEKEKGINLKKAKLGIVGVGHVGSAVLDECKSLVGEVILNDPPRQEKEGFPSHDLQTLAEECDIITIHTPLITSGPHPTYHLFDAGQLGRLKKGAVLINCGRGEVVDNDALLDALNSGTLSEAIIDTWENEPNISHELLDKVYIGTPHIAGYSADGKANGTRMSLQWIAQWLDRQGCYDNQNHSPQPDRQECHNAMGIFSSLTVKAPSLPDSVKPLDDPNERHLQLYNPKDDSKRLKDNPDGFEFQRGNYPLRREKFD